MTARCRLCAHAQRDGVAVDCCKLGPTDAAFAQHAAQLTGGVYLRPGLPRGLLQYLLVGVRVSRCWWQHPHVFHGTVKLGLAEPVIRQWWWGWVGCGGV